VSSTEKFESFNWIRGVADDQRITHMHRLILIRLVVHRRKDGRCDPGYQQIADEVGVGRASVFRAVGVGIKCGWLADFPKRGGRVNRNFVFTFPTAQQSHTRDTVEQSHRRETVERPTVSEKRPNSLRKRPQQSQANLQRPDVADEFAPNGHLTGKENGQSRAREGKEGAGEEKKADTRAKPNGWRFADLLAKLVDAAGDNVERNEWGHAYGIGQVEPILDLIADGRCNLDADILPAIAELVPTLAEPLTTWNDPRIRAAALARRRTREARAKEGTP
jgi:hypothetical protein